MSQTEDLRRQLEAAYAAIAELDEDLAAGRVSAADHAAMRARSEKQAAALLRRVRRSEQDVARAPVGGGTPARPLGARLRSPLVLAVGAVVVLALGTTAGVLLTRATTQTPAATTAPSPQANAPVHAELTALRREVEPESAPTPKLLGFAHLALDEGQVPAAIWAYRRVLAREPKNVEAITHMGIILYQGNHVDQALARVDEALAIDPSYAHAHWDRAQMLLLGRKDYQAAIRALEAFLALVPTGEDADRARQMLAEARRKGAAGGDAAKPPQAATTNPHATGAIPLPAGTPRPGGGTRSESAAPGDAATAALAVLAAAGGPKTPVVPAAGRPLPPERFSGRAAQAYRTAHDHGDTLAQLTCYCGCDVSAGHRNLRDCFLDTHGST